MAPVIADGETILACTPAASSRSLPTPTPPSTTPQMPAMTTMAASTDPMSMSSDSTTTISAAAWIIPTTIIAAVLVGALVSFLLIRRSRAMRAKTDYEKERLQDPRLSWARFERRWNLSEAERLREQEAERKLLIQRALERRGTRMGGNTYERVETGQVDSD